MAVEAEDLAARLKAEFPHVLRTGQLVAYYQPEIELSSGGWWRLYEDTEQAADPALA